MYAYSSVLASQLESHIATARDAVVSVLDREKAPYGTQNNAYFEHMRNIWLAQYTLIRASKKGYAQGLDQWQREGTSFALRPSSR